MNLDTKIATVSGRAISLRGDEIDTDRIIPARFLRCVTFDGLGEQAFRDERFNADGAEKKHPMNESSRAGAGILAVNRNFGCGSSREHAPQALARWGIRAIIGESFADIFAGNCAAIGVPAVTAAASDVAALQSAIEADPKLEISVNLASMTVSYGSSSFPVSMPPSHRSNFLSGSWDTLAELLSHRDEIGRTASRIPYLNQAGGPG